MANELFALLTEANTVYLHDVVLGGNQYHRYVDDYVNGHRDIDGYLSLIHIEMCIRDRYVADSSNYNQ